MSIHKTIADGRKRLGMTPAQFGNALGVTRGAVQQWENGSTAPKRTMQPAVAKLLGISVSELIGSPTVQDAQGTSVAPPTHSSTPAGFAQAVSVLAASLAEVDEATRRRVMGVLNDLAADPGDFERIARAAQAVCDTGKRRAA